jgi:FKBP-type peptidyl-prolyl cis-trans isomerase
MRLLGRVLIFAMLPFAAACGSSTPAAPSTSSAPYSQTDLTIGSGAQAAAGKALAVNYTGWLYDTSRPDNKGAQFDSSLGRGPYEFVLGAGKVIDGWDRGIAGMKVGGIRRLVIPPELAYGASGHDIIPPNATLLFDVELVAVQ